MGDLDKERLQCNKGNEGMIWVRRVERVGEEKGELVEERRGVGEEGRGGSRYFNS